jgi:hypothetical protein
MAQQDSDSVLAAVLKNLTYLRETWDQESIDPDSLRELAPVLRLLLIDGLIQKAWKAVGFEKQPSVAAYSLERRFIYAESASHKIELGWTGPARVKGLGTIGRILVAGANVTDGESARLETVLGVEKRLALGAFLEAPAIIVGGELIPRRVAIKYVVNRQTVADAARKRVSEAELRQYRRLDDARRCHSGHYPIPFLELLSIGQTLAGADDMTRLCDGISRGPARFAGAR